MIPTDKEFWEKCGFQYYPLKLFPNEETTYEGGIICRQPYWLYPVGSTHKEAPLTDLINLFKYAVPENCSVSFNRTKDGTVCILAIPHGKGQYGSANYVGKGDKDEDAIALRNAIWEVLK